MAVEGQKIQFRWAGLVVACQDSTFFSSMLFGEWLNPSVPPSPLSVGPQSPEACRLLESSYISFCFGKCTEEQKGPGWYIRKVQTKHSIGNANELAINSL